MRIVLEGGIYHIIQQGNNLGPIFAEDGDRLYFLHLLKECGKKFDIDIFAFCLMDNHIHILMRLSKANLSKSMHWLFMSYAKKFTVRHQRRGHLFTSRFKSILCLNDSYFLQLSRYIHLNPVKAGIIKNPFFYRWSSCNLFAKPSAAKRSFINTDFTFSFFSDHEHRAEELYKEFIMEGVQKRKGFEYPSSIFQGVLGDLEDLIKSRDRLPWFSEFLEAIRTKKGKEKGYGDYLKWGGVKRTAARDYLIYQKRRKGILIKDIAQEMKVSLKTVARVMRRVDRWRRGCS